MSGDIWLGTDGYHWKVEQVSTNSWRCKKDGNEHAEDAWQKCEDPEERSITGGWKKRIGSYN